MATNEEFKNFVLEQLENSQSGFEFSARKMFGEYCIYLCQSGKMPQALFLLCDNTLFVKQFSELKELCKDCDVGFAFEGAKQSYIVDFENLEFVRSLVQILAHILPEFKPKKRKKRLKA